MTHQAILLIHDTNPFSDPALMWGCIVFAAWFLLIIAFVLWMWARKTRRLAEENKIPYILALETQNRELKAKLEHHRDSKGRFAK